MAKRTAEKAKGYGRKPSKEEARIASGKVSMSDRLREMREAAFREREEKETE